MRFFRNLAIVAIFTAAIPLGFTDAVAQQEVVTEEITCVSANRQRTECRVKGRIKQVKQISAFAGTVCIQGFSWGYKRRHVWVDVGCSGTFEVETIRRAAAAQPAAPEPVAPQPAPQETTTAPSTKTVDCRAQGAARQKCRVGGQIQDVEPVGSFTSAPCQYGVSWGYQQRHVWVENGCEARFNVTFMPRADKQEPKPVEVEKPKVVESTASSTPLSGASVANIIAQGACTGLYPSLGAGGYVFAVPRSCSRNGPDCETICGKMKSTVDSERWRETFNTREASCFNSVHVYDEGPGKGMGAAGTRTYVYNKCGGGCGPNYCCCAAQ